MLISVKDITRVILSNDIHINGVFHLGAHECEEMGTYNYLGIEKENIVWIDAIPSKVAEATARGIPNVYSAVVTDKDGADVVFNVSNNVQSSSVLQLGTHLQEHPGIVYVEHHNTKSITIDTFFERNKIDASKYDFWNFDIQGAELMALKGAAQSIKYAKMIYLEVNEKELYEKCGLINEIDDFLSGYKFKRVLTSITRHGWGDALYILDNHQI